AWDGAVPAEGLAVGRDGALCAGPAGDVRPAGAGHAPPCGVGEGVGAGGDDGTAPEDTGAVDGGLCGPTDVGRSWGHVGHPAISWPGRARGGAVSPVR